MAGELLRQAATDRAGKDDHLGRVGLSLLRPVRGPREDLQVAHLIMKPVVVDVIDLLLSCQGTTKMALQEPLGVRHARPSPTEPQDHDASARGGTQVGPMDNPSVSFSQPHAWKSIGEEIRTPKPLGLSQRGMPVPVTPT